jgi:integrase
MARARRGHGEGSVYRRGDGRWIAQIEAGRHPETGRRRYARSARRTKPEALKALDELRRQVGAGVALERTLTVAGYLDRWVDDVLPYAGVTQSTVEKYQWVADHWLKPYLGTVRLDRLTPAHVQTMLRQLDKAGKSARTCAQARTVLRKALAHAQRTELITRNAAALAAAPRLPKGTSDALTADEAAKVLAVAAGHRLEHLAVLALHLGMRRGELLALDWSDVDFKAKELAVRAGKTADAARTLPLVAGTADILRTRRGVGPVFTTGAGNRLGARQALKVWHGWTEAAGIGRRRFHASRHTAATLMLERGVPLEVVSAILGHASLAITSDIYARVGADAKRRGLAALDEVLSDLP